jgi:hypothetical protein
MICHPQRQRAGGVIDAVINSLSGPAAGADLAQQKRGLYSGPSQEEQPAFDVVNS